MSSSTAWSTSSLARSRLLPPKADWRAALRRRAISAREALKRHSWAIGLMESRHPGPANLRNHNAVMGCLREAGFPFEMAVHAYSVQDAYIYGFALQERDLGFETPQSAGEAAQRRAETIGAPRRLSLPRGGRNEAPRDRVRQRRRFEWGFDLILDGLDRLRERP